MEQTIRPTVSAVKDHDAMVRVTITLRPDQIKKLQRVSKNRSVAVRLFLDAVDVIEHK